MNPKTIGEIGQACVIGELAKYGIICAIPMSDNLPYDFIIIVNEKLLKVQVKTSSMIDSNGSIIFDFSSNNWQTKVVKTYTAKDCDFVIGYDIVNHNTFIFSEKEFTKQRTWLLRYSNDLKKNGNKIHYYTEFLLTPTKLKTLFDYEIPNFDEVFSNKKNYIKPLVECICKKCNNKFYGKRKTVKYCNICRNLIRRKVKDRPNKEKLLKEIEETNYCAVGRKYGVSDKAVRKWLK